MPSPGDAATPSPSALTRSRWAVIGDLPALAVLYLAAVTAGSLAAGWLGLPVMGSPLAAAALLLVAAVVVAAVAWGCRLQGLPGSGREAAALFVPAAGVLVGIAALAVAGGGRRLEWFLNGDHPRHVVYVVDTWAQGSLRYAAEGYPRGWHSFLAAGWSLLGAGDQPADLIRLLTLTSMASLLLSALLALATAHLALALATRAGLSRWTGIAAGMVAGSLSLLNFAFANFQALGYQNSLLSAVALAACMREVLARTGSAWSVIVTCAGAAVVAHSWQLLLPATAVMVMFALHRWWSAGGPHRPLVASVATVALMLVVAGAVAVVRLVGMEHASEVGPDTPVPVLVLILGVGSVAALALWLRDVAVSAVAAACLLPAATALGVALVQGIALTTYYPSKLLWHTAVACLPALAAAAALAVHRVSQRVQAVGVVGVAVAALVVAYGLLMPWGAVLGVWSTVDGQRVLDAVNTPDATRAQVVWLESTPITDSVTRSLLDAYRAPGSSDRAPQASLSVAEECRLLDAAPAPVVLSSAVEAAVRARYGCVTRLDVVPVAPDG